MHCLMVTVLVRRTDDHNYSFTSNQVCKSASINLIINTLTYTHGRRNRFNSQNVAWISLVRVVGIGMFGTNREILVTVSKDAHRGGVQRRANTNNAAIHRQLIFSLRQHSLVSTVKQWPTCKQSRRLFRLMTTTTTTTRCRPNGT